MSGLLYLFLFLRCKHILHLFKGTVAQGMDIINVKRNAALQKKRDGNYPVFVDIHWEKLVMLFDSRRAMLKCYPKVDRICPKVTV